MTEELAKIDATVSAINNTVNRVISTYDNQIKSANDNATNALNTTITLQNSIINFICNNN